MMMFGQNYDKKSHNVNGMLIVLKKGFIQISSTEYKCPSCLSTFDDRNDTLLNRINKNKRGYTTTKCVECNQYFSLTYDFKGNFQSFKPNHNGH